MSVTHSTAFRNTVADAHTTALGASPKLKFRLSGTVGSPGTAAATLTLSATPFGAATSGVATANAITSDTAATGNATAVANATLETSGGTVVSHFDVAATVTPSVTGTSGAATVAVGSASGIAIGMLASGTGIATGARVVNVNGTTVTLDKNNTGTVSGTGSFAGDVALSNGLTIGAGDTVSCSSLTYTAMP